MFKCKGKESKVKTDIAKKQQEKIDDTYEFDKRIKEAAFEKFKKSNLIYHSKYSFYEYYITKNFNSLSLTLKYAILLSFYSNLNKFHNLNLHKESTKEKKVTVYDNPSELNNEHLEIYFEKHKTFSDAKKRVGK